MPFSLRVTGLMLLVYIGTVVFLCGIYHAFGSNPAAPRAKPTGITTSPTPGNPSYMPVTIYCDSLSREKMCSFSVPISGVRVTTQRKSQSTFSENWCKFQPNQTNWCLTPSVELAPRLLPHHNFDEGFSVLSSTHTTIRLQSVY